MKKKHSRIGFWGSIALHGALFSGIWWAIQLPEPQKPAEELTSISMEMMTALLEQPQVAVSPEPIQEPEEVKPEQTPETVVEPEPEPTPEPVEKNKPTEKPQPIEKPKEKVKPKEKPKAPEKPKEKPKPIEKQKEKPKEKNKDKVKTEKVSVQALEKGNEIKQGIVAKAIPKATISQTLQGGIPNGSANSANSNNSHSDVSSSNEVNAYKAMLQRLLQRRANNAYPQREKMMRKTGIVTLAFNVSASGKVTNVTVANSSGNENLDQAAVRAAEGTKMDSPPPKGLPSKITVPVAFRL